MSRFKTLFRKKEDAPPSTQSTELIAPETDLATDSAAEDSSFNEARVSDRKVKRLEEWREK
jgi:hypothetical protein